MRTVTKIIIIVVAAVLIIWDIIAAAKFGSAATESNVILSWATRHFTVPYAWGVLGGHFFWPREQALNNMRGVDSLLKVMLPSTAALILADIFIEPPTWAVPLAPVLGYFIGHFFWPQKPVKSEKV